MFDLVSQADQELEVIFYGLVEGAFLDARQSSKLQCLIAPNLVRRKRRLCTPGMNCRYSIFFRR